MKLSRLQNRIDFTRALAQAIGVLGLLLAAAFLVGLLGEGLHMSIVSVTGANTRLAGALSQAVALVRHRSAGALDTSGGAPLPCDVLFAFCLA